MVETSKTPKREDHPPRVNMITAEINGQAAQLPTEKRGPWNRVTQVGVFFAGSFILASSGDLPPVTSASVAQSDAYKEQKPITAVTEPNEGPTYTPATTDIHPPPAAPTPTRHPKPTHETTASVEAASTEYRPALIVGLAEALGQSTDPVINLQFPPGNIQFVLGTDVSDADLADPTRGWIGGGSPIAGYIKNNLGMNIAIRSHQDSSSIEALEHIASRNPDKFIVAPGSSSAADLSEYTSQVDADNYVIIAPWSPQKLKPKDGFVGPPELVLYGYVPHDVSPDQAAEAFAEMLAEQGLTDVGDIWDYIVAQARHNQGYRILPISPQENVNPPGWEDPGVYEPIPDEQ